MIPLRPSVWDRDDVLSESSDTLQQIGSDTLLGRDSLVLETVVLQDTQLTFAPNIDSTAIDTIIEIKIIETVDTTIITLAAPPPPPIIEKAASTGPNPLFLLWWLLLFIALAWIIYKWLTSRWQKKYWLEYNAKLQPLATLSNANTRIDFDFSELPLKTTALEKTDPLPTKELVPEIIEEPIVEIEPEEEVEVEEIEVKPETISDHQAEDILPPLESETRVVDLTASTVNQPDKNNSNSHWGTLFIVEFFTRLPRILFEMGRGILSIFSFFSTGNQKRKPLDLKWQDGISVVMILFFITCKTVIFPYAPTSIAGNILLGLLVWGAPALLRLHWGWGVLGIFIILGEFIGLIIYVILQALKDAAPSEGDSTNFLIGLAIVGGLMLLYWAKKNNFLPKFKSLVSFVLITGGAYFIFHSYIDRWILGDPIFDNFGNLAVQALMFYLFYLIVTDIIRLIFERKEKTTPTDTVVDPPLPVLENTEVETIEISKVENLSKTLSPEELKELFRTKNWYKKTDLDQFDMVSMPSMQLDEQSEFIVLYLPDCINLHQLYLSNNNFQEIPYEISELNQLEILNLSYNNIQTIFIEIEYLKNLKVLSLANNNISEIPAELANLTQLTQIDLTGNPLTKAAISQLETYFPTAILMFDALKETDISQEKIIEEAPVVALIEEEVLVKKVRKLLHKELKDPKYIYALSSLMSKKLLDLPLSVFQEFPNLKSLFLNSNLFTQIPEAVYHLPTLTTLGLSFNQISSLPNKITTLQNLKELDLSGNPIQSFSPALLQLTNLRKIGLGNLGLTIFPAFLLKMQELESINLSGNHILRIPEDVQNLNNLKELNLSFSGINTIPDEIFTLKNLRTLEWTGNNLEHISPSITKLEKLEKLAIGFNPNLESSTTILSGLPNLRELYISGIKGGLEKAMISNIGILKTLETLWLSYNELQALPSSLFELKQIRRLSLANNKLENLSEQLGELSNLEYLYLEKNKLTTLPKSIKKLQKLRHLNLANNPIDIKEKRALQRILPNVRIQY
jgi:Leucine-rich repeat (LRR) protein